MYRTTDRDTSRLYISFVGAIKVIGRVFRSSIHCLAVGANRCPPLSTWIKRVYKRAEGTGRAKPYLDAADAPHIAAVRLQAQVEAVVDGCHAPHDGGAQPLQVWRRAHVPRYLRHQRRVRPVRTAWLGLWAGFRVANS